MIVAMIIILLLTVILLLLASVLQSISRELEAIQDWACLRAIEDLGGESYGVPIFERLGGSYGNLYVILDRLVRNGALQTRLADPTPERGNRARRYFSLTEKGRELLDA